jgi:5-formyltetrahydrofolate cyclo-ligase
MNKSKIRQELTEIRNAISPLQKDLYSKKICQILEKSQFYRDAEKIGIYLSKPNEVNLTHLIHFESHKQFFIPKLTKDFSLQFYRYTITTELELNSWGILEPITISTTPFDVQQLDVILIPMLGFDSLGHRLGMGKGCYDRTIPKQFPGKKIGIAFECQKYPELPHEKHDIRLDFIITEQQIFKF